jgi:hypothetical protein
VKLDRKKGVAAQGFTQAPWEMFPANGIGVVSQKPIPSSPGESVFRDVPPPNSRWGPAPDPTTIRYTRPESAQGCEEAVTYNYFRTTLNVPAGVDRSSILFRLPRVADAYRLVVNGREVPHTPANGPAVPIGRVLRPVRNAVRVVLASWCGEPRADGAKFTAKSRRGTLTAAVQRLARK